MHEVTVGAAGKVASWLELSAGALATNVATLRTLSEQAGGPRALGAVLKGNAYGHGLAPMLPLVHPLVDLLYFITPADALAARAHERAHTLPPKQVLVIGALDAEEAVALAREGAMEGRLVVGIAASSAERYLSTELFEGL